MLSCGASPPATRLRIARHSATVHLVWSQPGFVLQGAFEVTGPWIDLTRGASINGSDHAVVFPVDSPHRFFRLRRDYE